MDKVVILIKNKQKMGTALGAWIRWGALETIEAPGLYPFFCGFDTHARKNWGQFRRLACEVTAYLHEKLHQYDYCSTYINSRREQSPFFLRFVNKAVKAGTVPVFAKR